MKIDVSTFRGTVEGVPRLVELLQRRGADATFLFSLGPDHTGRAIRRAFDPGVMRRMTRNPALARYGLKTSLYGTLLPGPDIGTRCADILREVRDRGFEAGIHAWDRVTWQNSVMTARAAWTERQLQLAQDRFQDIFGVPARIHGAPGWQMSGHGYRLTQRLGFDYCSDTRGSRPFIPVYNAELVACPQIPTTLPTFDECLALDGIGTSTLAQAIVAAADAGMAPAGHVFTLRAELEGMHLMPAFETLLDLWQARDVQFLSLGAYLEAAGADTLPRHRVERGVVPGRSGCIALQGGEFLAPARSTQAQGAACVPARFCQQ